MITVCFDDQAERKSFRNSFLVTGYSRVSLCSSKGVKRLLSHTRSSKVVMVTVDHQKKLYEHLEAASKLLKPDIPENANIVIKPNLNSLEGPQTGLTTDVQTVDALIRLLNEKHSPERIAVVESDTWCRTAEEVFFRLGYEKLPKKYENVELINLTKAKKLKVCLPHPKHFKFLWIAKTFLECDYYITAPTLRTLFPTRISCALKNQFGTISSRYKAKYHPYLDNMLANLNLLIRPDLCLVDGLIGYDGNPIPTGLLVLSNDPVANDTVVAKMIGLSPRRIGHIVLSESLGVGSMGDVQVFLDGEEIVNLDGVIQRFSQTNELLYFASEFGYLLIRSGDRLRSLGQSIIARVVTSVGPLKKYSKREILRMLFDRQAWKSFLSMSKEMQEGQTAT